MAKSIITTRDLTVYYGKHRGINDVNLSVEQGEVFGFLGPNGAGKTTTQRVLLDLIRPLHGEARIFGLDCQTQGVTIRERIGYLPGELSLPENLTANEYFDLIGRVRGQPNNRQYRNELCQQVSLDPSRRMSEYSRGNKQKVGVVAAFLSKPELLILDEPTTGLDPLVQRQVLELVRSARAQGCTVFFSSHVLSEVQSVCDRVGIIREGHLVATERVSDLTERSFRRVRLWFDTLPDMSAFELDYARLLDRQDNAMTFEVSDHMGRFLEVAVEQKAKDIETLPVTLEEIFLAYYGKREG